MPRVPQRDRGDDRDRDMDRDRGRDRDRHNDRDRDLASDRDRLADRDRDWGAVRDREPNRESSVYGKFDERDRDFNERFDGRNKDYDRHYDGGRWDGEDRNRYNYQDRYEDRYDGRYDERDRDRNSNQEGEEYGGGDRYGEQDGYAGELSAPCEALVAPLRSQLLRTSSLTAALASPHSRSAYQAFNTNIPFKTKKYFEEQRYLTRTIQEAQHGQGLRPQLVHHLLLQLGRGGRTHPRDGLQRAHHQGREAGVGGGDGWEVGG